MTKTYEECLDEVARKFRFSSWKWIQRNHLNPEDKEMLLKEAALLYGEAQYNKGVEDQEQAEIHYMETGKLTKPTFKP